MARSELVAENASLKLAIRDDCEKHYHDGIVDPIIEHQPWPKLARKSSLKKGRRRSVIAEISEELVALGIDTRRRSTSATKDNSINRGSLSSLKQSYQNTKSGRANHDQDSPSPVGEDLAQSSKKGIAQSKSESSKENTSSTDRSRSSRASASSKDGMPFQASKELAKSSKLEDQMNLQHLKELMTIFYEADENGSDGLDMDEFRAAFSQILGKGKDDKQMAIMFMKIDTNCDGTVDWDEFCTYMLLEYQEKEVMAGEKLLPFPHPLKVLDSPTHESVSEITYLPTLHRHSQSTTGGDAADNSNTCASTDGRFVSVTRDGSICFWKSNLTLQRTVTTDSCKSKFTWVTDLVVLPNFNKLMLSFTDDMLILYDLATAGCDQQCQIIGLYNCVVHMYYWYDPKDLNHAVLVMGDTGGSIIVFEFSSITNNLFGSTANHLESHRITFAEVLHYKHEGLKISFMPKVHSDWVYQVKYYPSVSYIMSCSSDSNCSLHLADIHRRKEASVLKVPKGVTSFDYCNEWNIIATGGLDRIVRYWNPYVTGKPIAMLRGHSSAVLYVAINSSQGYVLSLGKNLELRIWGIQHQVCVQNCYTLQQLLPHPPTAFYLHPHTGMLMVGTNQIAALESSQQDEQLAGGAMRGEVMTHEKRLCAALYNENFNQIVSGCHGSVVSVWDVDTGEKVIQFSHCHGTVEITAMAFDPTGRRLITGARDGSLKIWNFNNGACLSILESSYNEEVSCISFLKQRMIVGGWSRCLALYGDTRDPKDSIPKYWAMGVHKEDILCMDFQEPNILASASYDGNIVVWNLDVERATCKLKRKNSHQKSSSLTETSQSINKEFHIDDVQAIEKILFLKSRDQSNQSCATLVTCGTSGFVQMWNHFGGGLIGEYNIWDNCRHSLPKDMRELESITAMKTDSKDALLITGNSIGYIQLWKIVDYCMDVPEEQRPLQSPPQYTNVWRAHLSSIVSIDLAEDKGLLITASTDCSVRMWTTYGRYIGTFGDKALWSLEYPIKAIDLPRKIPVGINRAMSFRTLQTISGPCTSKWKLAKNLFQGLRQSKQRESILKLFGIQIGDKDRSLLSRNILGKCFERKTRFRKPVTPKTLKQIDGKFVGIYSSLHCPDITTVEQLQVSCDVKQSNNKIKLSENHSSYKKDKPAVSSLKHPHTESSLLLQTLAPITKSDHFQFNRL